MLTIYGYPLELRNYQWIYVPKEFRYLDIQVHYGELKLWALVDPNSPTTREVALEIYRTGEEMPNDPNLVYIKTVQLHAYARHIFERRRSE